MGKIENYRDLHVWQENMELAKEVYVLCDKLPHKEQYGLVKQMKRAVVSVASNIAEGHNRHATKEFIYFLRISLGSLAEVETQALLSVKLDYVNDFDIENMLLRSEKIGKMLRSLIQKLVDKLEKK